VELKKVSVTTEYQEDVELWGPDFVDVRSKLLLLFFLPGVQSLEIGALADARWDQGQLAWLHAEEDIDEEFWPVWPVERRPVADHLTTLRLVRSSVDPRTIERLLMQTPHVTVFEYDCFANVDHRPVDLDVLREALRHIRSTLASLTVRYENWHNEYDFSPGLIAGRLGPLHDFPALNTLIVSLPVLFGTDGINAGRHPTLSGLLPPALESLTITHDLYDDDDAFQGEFLRRCGRHGFVPRLSFWRKAGPPLDG
jgi:hypothetical protein